MAPGLDQHVDPLDGVQPPHGTDDQASVCVLQTQRAARRPAFGVGREGAWLDAIVDHAQEARRHEGSLDERGARSLADRNHGARGGHHAAVDPV